MTLYSISLIFTEFLGISQISDATTAKQIKIGQYCQRQRCTHVGLEQLLACFRVARVCQPQLGFLVYPRDAMLALVFATATCLSVRLFVMRRYCVKTINSSPRSPTILVFWCQILSQNSKGIAPSGGVKQKRGG